MTPEQKARKRRSAYRKWQGDDMYSWALFIDGRVAYSGMSQSEAKWRRDRYVNDGTL